MAALVPIIVLVREDNVQKRELRSLKEGGMRYGWLVNIDQCIAN